MSEPAAAGSSIYDLGYRRYEGTRLGRAATFATLYASSLRGAFGLGRRTASKVVPFALAFLAFVPAIVQVALGAVTAGIGGGLEVFRHEDYFGYVYIILVLFCAAVAPELVGRDQRHRTLSLYFSRAVARLDYAVAKLAALATAMLALTIGPHLVLFVGNGLTEDDLDGYLRERWDLIFPILGGSLVVSATLAGIGLAIASYVPRRAYATVAIVAVVVLTTTAAGILVESVNVDYSQYALLASPFATEGAIVWFFGTEPDAGGPLDTAALTGPAYLAAGLVVVALTAAVTLLRFRRIEP